MRSQALGLLSASGNPRSLPGEGGKILFPAVTQQREEIGMMSPLKSSALALGLRAEAKTCRTHGVPRPQTSLLLAG